MTPAETAPATDNTKAPEAVFRLIYKSRSRVPSADRETELGKIFSVARRKNTAQGITGALLLYEDWFAQTLEGEEGAVRKLFAVIENDSRHNDVEVREQGVVDARVFARWSMAKVGEHGEPDIPLIASKTGVAEAAARGSTPEQERVLDVMRDSTRGYGRSY